ncbi:coatomer gamma 2-subunit protein [Cystoisospora suis]|uniref:Coatomer gamma 2-subunit protein n=1 Tax=Cystoisospora suis TaxID=483139 RepID=A0A2C6KUN7_9APIC|nr:coatomer gamma 2-subunit protein [Cystoisospora suis]
MLSASSLRSKLQNLDLSKFGGSSLGSAVGFDSLGGGDNKPLISPYDCDKVKILQEARAFSESPLNSRKCCTIITKILYLLSSQENPLTPSETSTIFFGVTRLFQSQDDRLRRLIYMLLKELSVDTAEAFIVTSSLTKDMTSGSDLHRGNAMRVLSRIIDTAMVSQIERYLKTAIVDRNPFIASSALISGLNLYRTSSPDIVKRWINEIQSCLKLLQNSNTPIAQLHALVLLHQIKSNDPLSLQKSLSELLHAFHDSPIAECQLIRYVRNLLLHGLLGTQSDDMILSSSSAYPYALVGGGGGLLNDAAQHRLFIEYLERCLRHKHEMAMFEAARALCELYSIVLDQQNTGPLSSSSSPPVGGDHHNTSRSSSSSSVLSSSYDISGALTVLQILLSSPKPVVRFAAVHVINRLSQNRRLCVILSRCNNDLEPLLTDPNSSISTLALTTLLKTGHESNVERLTKQISSFSNDLLSDHFKLDIVRAILQLCLLYPNKYVTLMGYLSSNLREEGCLELKTETVNALITLTKQIPMAQETGLLQLCEFIEDCEFPSLCTLVLGFLGERVPHTTTPSKYIRFIYNRLILENAIVRVAGVDALVKIALHCPNLRSDILVLLESCLYDNDDEVRDRTQLYYSSLLQSLSSSSGEQQIMSSLTNGKNEKDRDLLQDLHEGGKRTHHHHHDSQSPPSSSSSTLSPLSSITTATTSEMISPPLSDLLDSTPPYALDPLCTVLEARVSQGVTDLSDIPTLLPSEEKYQEELAAKNQATTMTMGTTTTPRGSTAPSSSLDPRGFSSSSSGRGDSAMPTSSRDQLHGHQGGRIAGGGDALSRTGDGGERSSTSLSDESKTLHLQHRLHEILMPLISPEVLGSLLVSTKGSMLTEKESEYTVEVIKHIFTQFLVLEFRVKNTVEGQVLDNVHVRITPPLISPQMGKTGRSATTGGASLPATTSPWTVIGSLPVNTLEFNQTFPCFVLLKRNCLSVGGDGGERGFDELQTGSLQAVLSFVLKEAGDDIGYEDQYPIEPVVISIGNYIAPKMLRQGEFKVLWDSLEPSRGGFEVVGKFSLSFKSLESAVCGLINTLNLAPCDRSELIEPTLTTQTVLLSGTFYMGEEGQEGEASLGEKKNKTSSPHGYGIVARGVLFMSPDHGCLLKLVVRSELPQVCEAILQAFE